MQITITRPDDWHLHLRDGEALAAVLPHTARQFARAIVMPNLNPPVTTVEQAAAYRDRILAALPAGAPDALREYLHGDYLLLYTAMEADATVVLLSIRHHRELSFDFARLWPRA